MIPYGKHNIVQADIDAVTNVIQHAFLTQGKAVPAFEKALSDYTQAAHAVAVNSATSGLHIACLAADVGAGDTVWTTPNTFAASANCARYCGASVDFVDIDSATRLISITALTTKLRQAKLSGTLPKALIVVHFAGHACDMEAIARLSAEYGFIVIEDAAHALGGSYQGRYQLGNPRHSAMTVLSFHPVKSITTAEGGAVLTNNSEFAKKLRLFASHGITKEATNFQLSDPSVTHYEQQCLGYNYRLSDVHAALGVTQLKRLPEFIVARREIAKRYDEALTYLPVIRPELDLHSAWHLYVVELLEHDREAIILALREQGIAANVHYIPVHWHPYYQQLGFRVGQFPNSEHYYRRAISLPIFPDLTADNQDYVIDVLHKALSA